MEKEQTRGLLVEACKVKVAGTGMRFEADESFMACVDELAGYLTEDAVEFGFMLMGNVGNGKTTLLRAFQMALNVLELRKPKAEGSTEEPGVYGIWIVDAKEVCARAQEGGQAWERLVGYDMIGVEDMGKEPGEVLSYGNVMAPMVELIERRYDRGLFTAATTNLPATELSRKYGERVADRCREMFRRVVFTGGSFRGRKAVRQGREVDYSK